MQKVTMCMLMLDLRPLRQFSSVQSMSRNCIFNMYCKFVIVLDCCVGDYHCPVTFKIFNANTHIAAISKSGNVYAYEVRHAKLNTILHEICTLLTLFKPSTSILYILAVFQKQYILYLFTVQAIDRLNIKPAYWKDLVTDEPFTRADIIQIQDPTNLEKFNFAQYYHVKKNLKLLDEGLYIVVSSKHLKLVSNIEFCGLHLS